MPPSPCASESDMKASTPNLNRLIVNAKLTDKQLQKIGQEIVLPILLDNWEASKGGDGKSLSKLKESYRSYKQEKYGRDKADMMLTGHMTQSMISRIKSPGVAVVTAGNVIELNKLRGNVEKRPGLMGISKRMIDDSAEAIKKYMFNGVQTA